MKSSLKRKLFLSELIVLVTIALNSCSHKPDLLIGGWTCDRGACPDQEISFSVADGKFVYDSWLHSRPAVVGGSWKLKGKNLEVDYPSGSGDRWILVEVTSEKLQLQDLETSEIATFSRIKP